MQCYQEVPVRYREQKTVQRTDENDVDVISNVLDFSVAVVKFPINIVANVFKLGIAIIELPVNIIAESMEKRERINNQIVRNNDTLRPIHRPSPPVYQTSQPSVNTVKYKASEPVLVYRETIKHQQNLQKGTTTIHTINPKIQKAVCKIGEKVVGHFISWWLKKIDNQKLAENIIDDTAEIIISVCLDLKKDEKKMVKKIVTYLRKLITEHLLNRSKTEAVERAYYLMAIRSYCSDEEIDQKYKELASKNVLDSSGWPDYPDELGGSIEESLKVEVCFAIIKADRAVKKQEKAENEMRERERERERQRRIQESVFIRREVKKTEHSSFCFYLFLVIIGILFLLLSLYFVL